MKRGGLFPPFLLQKIVLKIILLIVLKKSVNLINLHGANKTQMCFVVPNNEKNAPERSN